LAASLCCVFNADHDEEGITVPDSSSLAFTNQAAIMAGLDGTLIYLLTHEILSTTQDTLAGLKKGRDTERNEQTALTSPP